MSRSYLAANAAMGNVLPKRSALRETHGFTPPAPRLVGVETNPGPPKSAKTQANQQKQPPKKTGRKRNRRRGGKQSHHAIPTMSSRYETMLDHPFAIAPIPLGFGTAIPTSLQTIFSKGTASVTVAASCFAIAMRPQTADMVNVYQFTNDTTALNAMSRTPHQASNAAEFVAMARGSRVVSAGLRVAARYAATSPRGKLAAFFCASDAYVTFESKTIGQLMGLELATEAVPSVSGNVMMEVQYRPFDVTSFEFTASAGVNGAPVTAYQPILIVIGSGWVPGTFSLDYQAVAHLETVSGFLSSGADDLTSKGGPRSADEALLKAKTVGDSSFTLDTLTDYVRQGANMMKTLHQAHAMLSGDSFGMRTRQTLTESASSAAVQAHDPVAAAPNVQAPVAPPPVVAPESYRYQSTVPPIQVGSQTGTGTWVFAPAEAKAQSPRDASSPHRRT